MPSENAKISNQPITMKTLKTLIASTVLATGLAVAPNASALAINDANYLGSFTPSQPSGETTETANVQRLVDLFNGVTTSTTLGIFTFTETTGGGAIPTPAPSPVTFGVKDESEDISYTVDVTGYTYLLGKFANTVSHVWYIGNLSGNHTLPTSVRGLSHITLFNATTTRVPDAGTSVLLLGAGLLGIGALRRRLAK
jgi:hypothetical protein